MLKRLEDMILKNNSNRLCSVDDNKSYTYSEVKQSILRLSNFLSEYDFDAQSRIIVFIPNDTKAIVSVFAILNCNMIAVPIDIQTPSNVLIEMINTVNAQAIICLSKKSIEQIDFKKCGEIEIIFAGFAHKVFAFCNGDVGSASVFDGLHYPRLVCAVVVQGECVALLEVNAKQHILRGVLLVDSGCDIGRADHNTIVVGARCGEGTCQADTAAVEGKQYIALGGEDKYDIVVVVVQDIIRRAVLVQSRVTEIEVPGSIGYFHTQGVAGGKVGEPVCGRGFCSGFAEFDSI